MRYFLPFILALLVIAVAFRVALFVTVVYFLIAVYILSRLWVRHSIENVRLGRSFLSHAFLGDRVEVTVQVQNAGRVPVPWIEVTDSVPTDLRATEAAPHVLSLGTRQKQRFSYRLDCGKRGYYLLGPFYFKTGDLLGIQQESLTLQRVDSLTVYPRVLSLERLGLQALAPQPALVATSPLIEDPSRVIGVRDYQQGDSPRRMHWKASARLSRLMVRQYDPTISRDTMIFLDLDGDRYKDPYDGTELGIVAAASIANHIVTREKLPVGLMTEGTDPLAHGKRTGTTILPGSGRGQLVSILEVLARAGMTRGTAFAESMRRQSVNLPWGASIVAITGERSDEVMETLFFLRRGGFAASLVLIRPYGSQPASEVETTGIPVHSVSTYQELEAV